MGQTAKQKTHKRVSAWHFISVAACVVCLCAHNTSVFVKRQCYLWALSSMLFAFMPLLKGV